MEITKVINCTKHPVHIVSKDGKELDCFAISNTVAQVAIKTDFVGNYGRTDFTQINLGQVTGLPEPADGVIYIVSALVKKALPDRKDIVVPSSSIRDKQGNVLGCRSLAF